jgi:hypothetical protein
MRVYHIIYGAACGTHVSQLSYMKPAIKVSKAGHCRAACSTWLAASRNPPRALGWHTSRCMMIISTSTNKDTNLAGTFDPKHPHLRSCQYEWLGRVIFSYRQTRIPNPQTKENGSEGMSRYSENSSEASTVGWRRRKIHQERWVTHEPLHVWRHAVAASNCMHYRATACIIVGSVMEHQRMACASLSRTSSFLKPEFVVQRYNCH